MNKNGGIIHHVQHNQGAITLNKNNQTTKCGRHAHLLLVIKLHIKFGGIPRSICTYVAKALNCFKFK